MHITLGSAYNEFGYYEHPTITSFIQTSFNDLFLSAATLPSNFPLLLPTSCGKVMFLQVSVILSTGGGGGLAGREGGAGGGVLPSFKVFQVEWSPVVPLVWNRYITLRWYPRLIPKDLLSPLIMRVTQRYSPLRLMVARGWVMSRTGMSSSFKSWWPIWASDWQS